MGPGYGLAEVRGVLVVEAIVSWDNGVVMLRP